MDLTVNESDSDDRKRNISYLDFLKDPSGYNMPMVAERLSHIINKINPEEILTILDIGSMDAWESINLAKMFNEATVYAFEPVKANFEICEHNVEQQTEKIQSRIHLQRIALNDQTGPMTFWELDDVAAAKRGNLNRGIGSKYQLMNPDMQPWEYNAQRLVTVVGYRLVDWCRENNIDCIDAIWMNVCGSELDVLRGADTILDNIQFIITKAGLKPYYYGHNMKTDIDQYLKKHGFIEWVPARRIIYKYDADVIYLNTRYANL